MIGLSPYCQACGASFSAAHRVPPANYFGRASEQRCLFVTANDAWLFKLCSISS